jgi:hypothetical protein
MHFQCKVWCIEKGEETKQQIQIPRSECCWLHRNSNNGSKKINRGVMQYSAFASQRRIDTPFRLWSGTPTTRRFI